MKIKSGAYLGGFEAWRDSKGVDAMFDEFSLSSDERAALVDAELLFGDYMSENYEGNARVIYRQGDELYEVDGGHCSCYGLEGQWKPLKVNAEYLRNLKIYRHQYDETARNAWEAMLAAL